MHSSHYSSLRSTMLGLTATGFANSSISSSAAQYGCLSEDTFVAGGGRLGPGCFDVDTAFCFASPSDLSIDAHLEQRGTKATGVAFYGNNNGVLRNRFDVTCVSIMGHRAAVGGIIRDSVNPETIGHGALIFLRDEGTPGLSTRDRSSPMFFDTLTSTGWPPRFPYTCPAPDSALNNVGFQALHSGDIVISAGKN